MSGASLFPWSLGPRGRQLSDPCPRLLFRADMRIPWPLAITMAPASPGSATSGTSVRASRDAQDAGLMERGAPLPRRRPWGTVWYWLAPAGLSTTTPGAHQHAPRAHLAPSNHLNGLRRVTALAPRPPPEKRSVAYRPRRIDSASHRASGTSRRDAILWQAVGGRWRRPAPGPERPADGLDAGEEDDGNEDEQRRDRRQRGVDLVAHALPHPLRERRRRRAP